MNVNIISNLWAMIPEHLQAYINTPETEAVTLEARTSVRSSRSDSVRVIPLMGPITQRSSFFTEIFGGTSIEGFRAEFDDALADTSVKGIVIEIDSGGGSVSGVHELSKHIYESRGKKPILASANSLAASAAYWIGSAADEFYVTDSGLVGSVGVVAVHEDISEALAKAGVKPTFITAGKHKAEGNSAQPLDDEAREEIQRQVDSAYDQFVTSLARNRGTTKQTVRDAYGQGRILNAKASVAAGMADKVLDIRGVIARAGSPHTRAMSSLKSAKASLDLLKAQMQ